VFGRLARGLGNLHTSLLLRFERLTVCSAKAVAVRNEKLL